MQAVLFGFLFAPVIHQLFRTDSSARFACLIGYVSKWKLPELVNHLAFLQAYDFLQTACVSIRSFATDLSNPAVPYSICLATPSGSRQSMTVVDRLRLIIRNQLEVAESHITPEASWIEDLDAEAYNLFVPIATIEQEFQVKIPNADADRLLCMKNVEEWLAKQGVN